MKSNSVDPNLPSTPLVPSGLRDSRRQHLVPSMWHTRRHSPTSYLPMMKTLKMDRKKTNLIIRAIENRDVLDGGRGEESDVFEEEDDDLCPVDCVREFKSEVEFQKILEKAKEMGTLVVVDFYRTSCGSCKYIEQGFAKLCKGSGDQEASVVFLKHNVIDEYDEQSEVAERLHIKAVPLFHFYKNGVLLEAFATRDKDRILAAIQKYTLPS